MTISKPSSDTKIVDCSRIETNTLRNINRACVYSHEQSIKISNTYSQKLQGDLRLP
jgi:hypothetical protein